MKNKVFFSLSLLGIVGVLLAIPPVSLGKRSYDSILKEWTQRDEAYNFQNLEARLVWTCTYESPTFRAAKLDRMVELFRLSSKKLAELSREEEEAAAKHDIFFCAIYVGSRVHKFIEKDWKEWNLVMERDGTPIRPEIIELAPSNQINHLLYPYIDRWSKPYRLMFSKSVGPDTRYLQLKMITIPADSTLEWNLAKLRD